MGRHKQINGKFIPAGLAVRHDILKMIYQTPTVSIHLPSAIQLAKKHHVSRATVTAELKKLSDIGLIIGKPGIGSFSNPEKSNLYDTEVQKKFVGILNADTWKFINSFTDWALMSYIGMELIPDIAYPQNMVLSTTQPEQVYQELLTSNMSGFIWIFPFYNYPELYQKLQENGKAVITIYRQIPNVPYLEFNQEKIGADIANLLLQENRTRILWCLLGDDWSRRKMQGAIDFRKAQGITQIQDMILDSKMNFIADMEKIFSGDDLPDAVFIHSESVFRVLELLKKYKLTEKVIMITSWGHVRKRKDFQGIVYKHDFQRLAQIAAEYMRKLLNGQKDEVPLKTVLDSNVFSTSENKE